MCPTRSSSTRAAPPADIPSLDFRLLWVTAEEELQAYVPAWRRLIETAIEGNVFFEPEVLLASWRHLRARNVQIGLVLAPPRRHPEGEALIAGLFPIVRSRGRAELWTHSYVFQGTPLLRADVAQEVWRFFLQAVTSGSQSVRSLLRAKHLHGDGPCWRALVTVLATTGQPYWVQEQHLRAEFRPQKDAERFLRAGSSRKVRRNLNRQRRLLEARGTVAADVAPIRPAEADVWCTQFLALEASGWKGAAQSALAANEADALWFRAVIQGLAPTGRALGARLTLNGQPIAMGVVWFAGDARGEGAYFKIAFDEQHADVSAGALLQVECIRAWHAPGGPGRIDSCAAPGHPMIERVWPDRRLVQTLWVARPNLWGRLRLWWMQALAFTKQTWRQRRP